MAELDDESAEAAEIQGDTLEEPQLPPRLVNVLRQTWDMFLKSQETKDAAGEAIYGAVFDAAPSLQDLFKTPRAVQGIRFANALTAVMGHLDNGRELKIFAETVGFGHLNIEVTVPRAMVFRDAILDLLDAELGEDFTDEARAGWDAVLSYIGGACIYVRRTYADRLQTLSASWEKVCKREQQPGQVPQGQTGRESGDKGSGSGEHSDERKGSGSGSDERRDTSKKKLLRAKHMAQQARTDFKEMFEVNMAVMGHSSHRAWLMPILHSWDAMVTNVQNYIRLTEECNVLVLRITKETKANVDLNIFRAVMLASLRSLLPKEWDDRHELAWNWLWDNVQRVMKASLGKPQGWEIALGNTLHSLDDSAKFRFRKAIYDRFFEMTPQGQEYFKQSDTRLHYIAERITQMTLEIFHDPGKMVDEITGLGLRHVGYAIPPELMAPFVSAFMDVWSTVTADHEAVDACRWSLNLIQNMLVRTINEGSTLVMRAITNNSVKMLRKAITVAPRGGRCKCMLNIQVGNQAISPLQMALESGSLDAAQGILTDLLTIRADRERYYYGMEELFTRHPDIIQRLCKDAPNLLSTLFAGLVWRSNQTKDGKRRVNYYVKHLITDNEGGVSRALEWMCQAGDPKLVVDPVVQRVSDVLWEGIVSRRFIVSKTWFVLSLIVFMLTQALLPQRAEFQEYRWFRVVVFTGRLLNYSLTMLRLKLEHVGQIATHVKKREIVFRCWIIPVPKYLEDMEEIASLALLLFMVLMCVHEPFLWCINGAEDFEAGSDWPITDCPASEPYHYRYSAFTAIALVVHWLMLIPLAVFSTGLSAFVLVCVEVLSEFSRFLVALFFLIFTFASSISLLEHDYYLMRDIPNTAVALFAITAAVFEDDYRDMQFEPALLLAVLVFVSVTVILLLNLLIAQLNTTYFRIYQDTVGWALINRATRIVEVLGDCPEKTWTAWKDTLGLDDKLEFNEGDVGVSGGLQDVEPASLHVVTEETVLRFGGTCRPDEPWPEKTEVLEDEEEDKLTKLEGIIHKTCQRLASSRGSRSKRKGPKGDSQNSSTLQPETMRSTSLGAEESSGAAVAGGA